MEINGTHFVRKQDSDKEGVNKLKTERAFLKYVQTDPDFKDIGSLYPKLLSHYENEKTYYYDMEYIHGPNLGRALFENQISAPQFYELLDALFSVLIPKGYLQKGRALPESESERYLESIYFNRVFSRIEALKKRNCFIELETSTVSLTELLNSPIVMINEEQYTNPLDLLSSLKKHAFIKKRIFPRYMGFCAHGDLTPTNMLWDSRNKRIVLVDNRGIYEWDPFYDFGKIKFALSGFYYVVIEKVTVKNPEKRAFKLSFQVNPTIQDIFEELNKTYLSFLEKLSHFAPLIEHEPYWKDRVLFVEASQYIADMPYRLQCGKSPVCVIADFLLGTLTLNQLWKQWQIHRQ